LEFPSWQVKKKNRAIDFFQQAAEYFELTKNLKELVNCYKALGLLYEKQDDALNSEIFNKKLLNIEKQLLDEEEINRYLFYYEYYNVLGFKEKALEHYQVSKLRYFFHRFKDWHVFVFFMIIGINTGNGKYGSIH